MPEWFWCLYSAEAPEDPANTTFPGQGDLPINVWFADHNDEVKKHVAIWVGVLLALALSVLTISRLSARRCVSMSLLEYKRWPHGAMVRLRNNTPETIRYLAERDDTPTGAPILHAQKTSNGWTGQSATVGTVQVWDLKSRKPEEVFVLNPPTPPKAGDRLHPLLIRDLKPGRSADFFVWLKPGAAPQRIGTVCLVPQSELARKLQPWLSRIKQWCGIKMTVPGQVQVWCPEPLCLSPSGEPGEGK